MEKKHSLSYKHLLKSLIGFKVCFLKGMNPHLHMIHTGNKPTPGFRLSIKQPFVSSHLKPVLVQIKKHLKLKLIPFPSAPVLLSAVTKPSHFTVSSSAPWRTEA